MWLRNIQNNFREQTSGTYTLNFLWRKENIFVMDNHLAAAWCWKQCCVAEGHYNFLHIDRHRDFLCNLPLDKYLPLRENEHLTIDDYCNLQDSNFPVFQWDNYIKPTQLLYPHWFTYNIFVTQEGIVDTMTSVIVPQMFIQYVDDINDLFYTLRVTLSNSDKIGSFFPNKWIVNIDLDFFFDSNYNRLYDDTFIQGVAQRINAQLTNIQTLTISLSPECCGGWDDAIEVLDIFAKELTPLRGYVFPNSYQ